MVPALIVYGLQALIRAVLDQPQYQMCGKTMRSFNYPKEGFIFSTKDKSHINLHFLHIRT